jgi:hypothetical protein
VLLVLVVFDDLFQILNVFLVLQIVVIQLIQHYEILHVFVVVHEFHLFLLLQQLQLKLVQLFYQLIFQLLVLLQDRNQITEIIQMKFRTKKEKIFTSPSSICVAVSLPVDCGINNGEEGRLRNLSV